MGRKSAICHVTEIRERSLKAEKVWSFKEEANLNNSTQIKLIQSNDDSIN